MLHVPHDKVTLCIDAQPCMSMIQSTYHALFNRGMACLCWQRLWSILTLQPVMQSVAPGALCERIWQAARDTAAAGTLPLWPHFALLDWAC